MANHSPGRLTVPGPIARCADTIWHEYAQELDSRPYTTSNGRTFRNFTLGSQPNICFPRHKDRIKFQPSRTSNPALDGRSTLRGYAVDDESAAAVEELGAALEESGAFALATSAENANKPTKNPLFFPVPSRQQSRGAAIDTPVNNQTAPTAHSRMPRGENPDRSRPHGGQGTSQVWLLHGNDNIPGPQHPYPTPITSTFPWRNESSQVQDSLPHDYHLSNASNATGPGNTPNHAYHIRVSLSALAPPFFPSSLPSSRSSSHKPQTLQRLSTSSPKPISTTPAPDQRTLAPAEPSQQSDAPSEDPSNHPVQEETSRVRLPKTPQASQVATQKSPARTHLIEQQSLLSQSSPQQSPFTPHDMSPPMADPHGPLSKREALQQSASISPADLHCPKAAEQLHEAVEELMQLTYPARRFPTKSLRKQIGPGGRTQMGTFGPPPFVEQPRDENGYRNITWPSGKLRQTEPEPQFDWSRLPKGPPTVEELRELIASMPDSPHARVNNMVKQEARQQVLPDEEDKEYEFVERKEVGESQEDGERQEEGERTQATAKSQQPLTQQQKAEAEELRRLGITRERLVGLLRNLGPDALRRIETLRRQFHRDGGAAANED